jgi:uncharacterized damage-inducible protein DinB
MRRTVSIVCGIVLTASAASAQQPSTGLAAGLQAAYNNIKRNLTEAADKMPDADYGFRPSQEIRTYGGQLGHVANAHYAFCSAVKGEMNPNQGQDLEKKATKAEFVKALADSYAYCDTAFSELTDASAAQLATQGRGQVAKGAILSNLIAHDNEEYGIVTVYLRIKTMVPPSTERAQRGRGGRQ